MIHICEVGPRDGLQNENTLFTVEQKVEMIQKLIHAGMKKIEVASFVNPKLVPQMANGEEVLARLPQEDILYAGLVLSESGLERALRTPLHHIHVSMATSSTFNQRNIRRTLAQSLTELTKVIHQSQHLHTVTILGTAFGCPFEGKVEQEHVLSIAESFVAAGCQEITLADTTGMANPLQVQEMIGAFRKRFGDSLTLGMHFHNTRGLGLVNAYAAYLEGVTHFDSSVAGLGGCPFAPGATGNICTEDLLYMFHGMNVPSSIDISKLITLAKWLESQLHHPLPSMIAKAGLPCL